MANQFPMGGGGSRPKLIITGNSGPGSLYEANDTLSIADDTLISESEKGDTPGWTPEGGGLTTAATFVATSAASLLVEYAGLTKTIAKSQGAITVSSLADQTVANGAAVSIDAASAFSGTVTTYSIVSGPAWLSINPATGAITGTAPGSDVTVSVTVRASNNAGSVTDTFTLSALETETVAFLLVGQSNMVGRPTDNGSASWPAGVLQYGYNDKTLRQAADPLDHWDEQSGDMGLARQFVIDYLTANPNNQVIVIPRADGGTGFVNNQWNPGDPQYQAAVDDTNALLAANPEVRLAGILWHQGENDRAAVAAYEGALHTMITSMRDEINGATQATPFVLGQIKSESSQYEAGISTIIGNVPAAIAYTSVVAVEDLTLFDGLHFDGNSLDTMGSRYLAAIDTALANVPEVPGAPTNLTATAGNGRVDLAWVAPANNGKSPVTDYVIERRIGAGAFSVVADGISTSLAFADTGLTNGTAVTYRVSAVNAVGAGSASATATATPEEGSSLAESGAVAHWLFGTDNPTNADLVSSRTPTGPAHAASAGFITSPVGQSQGLDTGILETLELTVIAVIKVTGSVMVGGTLTNASNAGGISGFCQNDEYKVNARDSAGNIQLGSAALADKSVFRFLAFGIDRNESSSVQMGFIGLPGGSLHDEQPGLVASDVSGRNISIGNVHYPSSYSDVADFAEFIVFDSLLTEAELEAVYQRSKTRLSARGITLD